MTEGIRSRRMVVRSVSIVRVFIHVDTSFHFVTLDFIFTRASDSETLKARLECMDWWESSSCQATPIAFVILVVNGLSVLESMDSADETKKGYSEIIKTTFKDPLLSFRGTGYESFGLTF